MRRGVAIVFPLALALAMGIPAAQAFVSAPPGSSPHDELTALAAAPLGFDDDSLPALQEAVRRPDLDEVKVDGTEVYDAGADYEPAHHCDRMPPTSNEQSFVQTGIFVRLQRDQALQMARANHPERAVWFLGYALHALQDCHSHSNIVEKDEATQLAYRRAILDGGELPFGVYLTGFQPDAEEADFPPGDSFPHGAFNLDDTDATQEATALLPDGRTKHRAAQDLAVAASHELLSEFLANLTAQERAQLFDATYTLSPKHLPSAGPVFGLVAVGVAAAVTLALRPKHA